MTWSNVRAEETVLLILSRLPLPGLFSLSLFGLSPLNELATSETVNNSVVADVPTAPTE